jgi:hypothetical protein
MNAEHVGDAIKLAPPVAVSITSVTGMIHWDTLSYILASIYSALAIGNFIWTKYIKPWRQSHAGA